MSGTVSGEGRSMTRSIEQGVRAARSLVPYWSRIIGRAGLDAISPESQLIASSIGFFTLFSIFPLVLLAVAIGSRWVDPLLVESRMVRQLEFVAPALESLIGSNLHSLVTTRAPVTGIALLALFWSATSVFNVLTRAMDKIWGADINRSRLVWRHRGLAIISVLVITGLLLVASIVESTIIIVLNRFIPDALAPLEPLTTEAWSLAVSVGLFFMLYYFLPHIRLTWRSALPGAIIAGTLWDLAKRAFLAFIAYYLHSTNLVYGSVATIIAFLAWSYISSVILLFGAYVNRRAADARAQRLKPI